MRPAHRHGVHVLLLIVGVLAAPALLVAGTQNAQQNPFFVYNFGRLTERPAVEQVKLLQTLGYDGISLGCESDAQVKELDAYFAAADAAGPAFRVFAVYVFYKFAAPPAERERWRAVLSRLAGRNTSLWLILGPGAPDTTDDDAAAVIATVADAAREQGTEVTLYPHSKCYVTSAEEALPFVRRLNRPNLGLAVHLCHELRAGNGHRLDAVVRTVAPFIRFATLAGADAQVDWTSARTMDRSTIKPLDEGAFDLRTFVTALQGVDYRGPVGFINFKIEQEPDDYLKRSIARWRQLACAPLAADCVGSAPR